MIIIVEIELPLPHPFLTLPGKVRVNFTLLSSLVLSLSLSCMRLSIYSQIIYNFTEHEDNKTKLSGYDTWGQTRSSMTSRMTLSSKSPVRNLQCPPCPPFLTPYS